MSISASPMQPVPENLLSNAPKFTPSDGDILINASRYGDAEVL
jgi:signal transduction histidine kinase